MTFTWWGVPGALVLIATLGAAITALRTEPGRSLNRRLATILLLDGLWVGLGSGVIFFFNSRELVYLSSVVVAVCLVAVPFQYLGFIGAAVDSPLAAPFRSRRAFVLLTLVSAVCAAFVVRYPLHFVTVPYSPGWAPWNFQITDLGQVATRMHALVEFYALAAAISAYRRTTPGCASRSRAGWFVMAFGFRDAYFTVSLFLYPQIRPVPFWGDVIYNPLQAGLYFAFVLLLSYGVLHTQLLDIELRVKIALQRSTVIATVAAAFLIGSEALEQLLPVQSKMIGLVLAVALALAFHRMEAVVKRVLDRIMPGVEKTPEYREARRHEVYRAALEGALQDDVITKREQAILAALRLKLGITEEEAAVAEREVVALRAATAQGARKLAVN